MCRVHFLGSTIGYILGDSSFKCDIYGKVLSDKGSLMRHQKTDTGENHSTVSLAGNNFSLVVHQRKRTGDSPFKCGICRKGFSCKGALLKHVVTHVARNQRDLHG
jgi:KRAB domain-containing zinc finger protein